MGPSVQAGTPGFQHLFMGGGFSSLLLMGWGSVTASVGVTRFSIETGTLPQALQLMSVPMTPAGAVWGASSTREPPPLGLLQGSGLGSGDRVRSLFSLCFIFIHFETGSHHVVLTGLELNIG